ncbi:sensor histidine kinase [Nocardioides bruguierae]|uniref:Sensor histidine kinase n=1 Tax=Nocardioides bruguierae TaxID=2945102 RepID=A0A9X2IFU5_9ACTN|nr:sensor histidine kinase [Nocardioides bruguierae]MCL8027040.1 sensor histidine kinase [Nocardioides bruguierae]MCM0621667.1 sensor histidine kinase [Nocardioides bruguierae]
MLHPTQDAVRFDLALRVFVLLAMTGPVLWTREVTAIAGLGCVAMVWATSTLALTRPASVPGWSTPLEAAIVGVVAGLTVHQTESLLAATALAPLLAGLRRGLASMLLAAATSVVAVTLAAAATAPVTADTAASVFTWAVLGLGLGLVATFLHSTSQEPPDALAPYRHASALLRQLNDLTDGLSSGLDPSSTGGLLLSTVRDALPTSVLAVYLPGSGATAGATLTPLVTKSFDDDDLLECSLVAETCRATGEVERDGHAFAVPLHSEDRLIAVLAGTFSDRVRLGDPELERRLADVPDLVADMVVTLEAALLFDAFRDAATADERRRLSREMHDGVAQDIASLGYVVDALALTAMTPAQREQFTLLRERVSAVVTEVRRSVLTLRTTVGSAESLGSAISAVARNMSQVSGIPIEVTLDEQPQRLRPEVEAELFRVTQEAVNNAVKHARCSVIRVACQVSPPAATITVRDDGRGLGDARADSYGLSIMQERASLVGADLEIEEPEDGGTRVTVRLRAENGGLSAGGLTAGAPAPQATPSQAVPSFPAPPGPVPHSDREVAR